ncbi:MAG: restriction endonuclease subunit S [Leptolyngbya sp. BL-A-14]
MSKWQEVYLNEAFDIGSGLSKPAEDFGSGFPFLSFKEIFNNFFVPEDLPELVESSEEERDKCSVKKGDVFLTRTSETVKELGMSCVALKDYENATFNGFTKRLRPNSDFEVVPEYAGYYFRSSKFRNEVTALSSASTRASLNNEMLGRLKIVLPSKKEQEEIAAVLICLDRKISNLRQQNETLERIAQTLFKHWFVDFEFPNEDGKPYKSSGGEMVRSELGEIPIGWRVLTLKEICETIYRYPQFYGMDKSDKGVPVIRGEHLLPNGKISNDFSDYWFVSNEFSEKFPRTILNKFDVVLSVRGSVGNYSWVGDQHIGVQISPNTIRLSANPKILHDCLLYPFLKGCNFKNRLLQTVSSSAVPAINASEFKTFDFIIPTLSVQEQISPLFRSTYQKIDANERQIQTLSKTRDVLLPKLMSGKLRIKN